MPLKRAASSVARNTIKTAFDQLEKVIFPEDSHNFDTITLEQVRKSALVIEDQLAARKSLRNMRRLVPFLDGLEHYAKSIDILCNGTPYLAWIWAPLTLVLRIASEYVEAFERIVSGYSRIASSLARFKILQATLSTNLDFQQTLAVFYADILQFHRQAYIFVRRKSWKLLFLTSWGRFDRRFDHLLDDMKQHGELVDLQANAHSIADVRQMREDIKSWKEENIAQVQRADSDQGRKKFDSIITWLKSEESDQLAIMDTISAEGAKHAGTCSWALKTPKIRSWLQPKPECPVLWLQGTPGSGKSVLASQIVRFARSSNKFLIHHFCTQRYASSIAYEQILRSMLLQLLCKDEDLVAHVYEDHVLGKKPPTIQTLEKLLYTLFAITSREPRQVDYIWIIIDGLNECDTRRQGSVVSLINQITNRSVGDGGTICKILISSRYSKHIADRLKTKQIISLTEEKRSLRLAIRQYVSQRLRSMHDKLQQLELLRKDIDEIELVITNKSDGMFLYARLVLDYLSKNIFYRGSEMKAAIDELPKELSEFYRKILMQILVQVDERSAERIKSIFSWIAFAKRPLKRMEFLSALTFSAGDPDVNNLVPKYVLDICGALVEERPDTTLTFIHISVKEFLQSTSSNFGISEAEAMSQQCLSTLACLVCGIDIFFGRGNRNSQALRVVKGIHGFHVYATEFWTEYLLHHVATRSADTDSPALELASVLAQKITGMVNPLNTSKTETDTQGQPVDENINLLEEWPLVKQLVETSLRARSLKRLENNLIHELQTDPKVPQSLITSAQRPSIEDLPSQNAKLLGNDAISLLLASYQDIVRLLLQQDQYPGISPDELDLFKSQFGTSAFTCRLKFCPRATVGFESEEARRQHEIDHTQISKCTVLDCPYPPFVSVRALRNHINKHHRAKAKLRPIRNDKNPFLTKKSDENHARSSLLRRTTPAEMLEEQDHFDTRKRGVTHLTSEETEIPVGEDPVRTYNEGGYEDQVPKSEPKADSTAAAADGDGGIEGDVDQADIKTLGYLACSIPGCGAKLEHIEGNDMYDQNAQDSNPGCGVSLEHIEGNDTYDQNMQDSNPGCGVSLEHIEGNGMYDQKAQEFVTDHYWNCHHADSMDRCAVNQCQMIFSSPNGLQAHYEQRHTAMFCNDCDADKPYGFAVEDELRQHWQNNHMRLVKSWVCVTPLDTLDVVACGSCATGHKFDRRYDALRHLISHHLPVQEDARQSWSTSLLLNHVKEVWFYERLDAGKNQRHDLVEESDDKYDEKVGEMFYQAELA